jgi:hypothetical protein
LPINAFDNNDEDVFEHTSLDDTKKSRIEPGEVLLGSVISIDALGQAMVDFPLNPEKHPIAAITTFALTAQHVSRQVALLFNWGDLSQPIIMGLVHSPLQAMLDNFEHEPSKKTDLVETNKVELSANLVTENVSVEGKKITFEAQDEMVFKCGQSSITLTKEGKVLIRGKYLLNRSTGVNRIMGGSVQVN